MEKKKKRFVWRRYLGTGFSILIGAAGGYLIGMCVDNAAVQGSLWKELLFLVGLILAIYTAIFAQIIIHEAGHLVFGLLTGYQFCSFRIMSFIWIKQNGEIRMKRFSLAGTAGQCLMVPPAYADGKVPVVLYNLGGPLMNLIAGLVFAGLYFAFAEMPYLANMMIIFAISGFGLALMNGIPMRSELIDNDGYNAFSMTRNENARHAFWAQLKANALCTAGIRLKDMPEEWFAVPNDGEMKNSKMTAIGVFACNRLMDEHRFEEADRLMSHLLEIDSGMAGLHRKLMICDRMYCELIGANRREVLNEMRTQEQTKFMKKMKTYPSVIRTEYVYTLLAERKPRAAKTLRVQFEKIAETYPYSSDVQSERELMEVAERLVTLSNFG